MQQTEMERYQATKRQDDAQIESLKDRADKLDADIKTSELEKSELRKALEKEKENVQANVEDTNKRIATLQAETDQRISDIQLQQEQLTAANKKKLETLQGEKQELRAQLDATKKVLNDSLEKTEQITENVSKRLNGFSGDVSSPRRQSSGPSLLPARPAGTLTRTEGSPRIGSKFADHQTIFGRENWDDLDDEAKNAITNATKVTLEANNTLTIRWKIGIQNKVGNKTFINPAKKGNFKPLLEQIEDRKRAAAEAAAKRGSETTLVQASLRF